MKKKISVQGLDIRIESINDSDYVSLTDIAKQTSKQKPIWLITNWLKNSSTLLFLEEWEKLHNDNFKVGDMTDIKNQVHDRTYYLSVQNFIDKTDSIGLVSKVGRYGGTYSHSDIALNFCYWISPPFQVWLLKSFQQMYIEKFQKQSLEWHISRITDNVDEIRNLLDTIPHQKNERNRIKKVNKKNKK